VIFGIDRPVPGLLLFRSKAAEGLTDEEFLDKVWPVIEEANERSEGFSQIGRGMVIVMDVDVRCPSTDKGSIKRAAVYREFKDVINKVYSGMENSSGGSLKLSVVELEEWIMQSFAELGIPLENKKVDFFSVGVDSLKAIQMRSLIIKTLDLGGNVSKCGSMIVYDCGNTAKLAKNLFDVRTGKQIGKYGNELASMEALIQQFSKFEQRPTSSFGTPETCVVVSSISRDLFFFLHRLIIS